MTDNQRQVTLDRWIEHRATVEKSTWFKTEEARQEELEHTKQRIEFWRGRIAEESQEDKDPFEPAGSEIH